MKTISSFCLVVILAAITVAYEVPQKECKLSTSYEICNTEQLFYTIQSSQQCMIVERKGFTSCVVPVRADKCNNRSFKVEFNFDNNECTVSTNFIAPTYEAYSQE